MTIVDDARRPKFGRKRSTARSADGAESCVHTAVQDGVEGSVGVCVGEGDDIQIDLWVNPVKCLQ